MADSSVPDLESKTISLSAPGSEVPAWYPAWAQELAGLYYSGSVCLFLLHGNVHDLIPCVTKKGTEFCSLSEFLVAAAVRIVGRRVLLRSGAGVAVGGRAGCQASPGDGGVHVVPAGESQHVAARSGPGAGALEQITQRNLLEEKQEQRKRIAYLFEYAQHLIPSADLNMLARGEASRLVRLIAWRKTRTSSA